MTPASVLRLRPVCDYREAGLGCPKLTVAAVHLPELGDIANDRSWRAYCAEHAPNEAARLCRRCWRPNRTVDPIRCGCPESDR